MFWYGAAQYRQPYKPYREWRCAASSVIQTLFCHARFGHIAGSFAGLILLMCIVLLANPTVNRLERYLLRWRPKQEADTDEGLEVY
jgi:hypothetical protein